MSREYPDVDMEQEAPQVAGNAQPTGKPDEYIVQTRTTVESWDLPKMKTGKRLEDGSDEIVTVPKSVPVRTTKLVNGYIGPFRNRAIAEQTASSVCMKENVISAEVVTVVDGPQGAPAERQVPASEDVLREMVAQGKVPGVPADATVRVEGEPQAAAAAPDNMVPFPIQPGAAEGSSET